MKTVEEITALMKGGRIGEAKAALDQLLASEPENVEARILWGTCCQILGDDANFRQVYADLAPRMDEREQAGEKSHAVELWVRYKKLLLLFPVVGMLSLGMASGCISPLYGVPPMACDFAVDDANQVCVAAAPTNRNVVVKPPVPPRPMPAYAVRPNPPVPPRPVYGVRPPQPGPPRPLHKYGVPRPPQPPPPPPPPPMPQPCTKYAVPPELIHYPKPPVAPPAPPKPPLKSGLFDGTP